MSKLNFLLSAVSGATAVDASYLVEDDDFLNLLRSCASKLTMADAVQRLTDYVNDNY